MSTPPSGTVTFLFTDIEGSTRRWEDHPQQMRHALSRHDAILRDAIEANDGYVFKTVGDAFCAAFPTAQQALDAALSAQKHLHSEEWGEALGAVRVRAALYTGSVDLQGGDYFGQPVNRVARLLSAGHGGQTLLSEVTYGLVRDTLPSGVSVSNMGEHRLKDLYRPERIFQLLIQGLPSEFPPLKTLDNRPNNLPVQLTPLIGREKETEAVCTLLREDVVHLVTLTGPGGTGKTRLALQAAAEMLDRFADGVWFVDLAPITDAGLVVSTIAQTLGVKEAAGEPLLDTLKMYLKEKVMLLVLDNFEQVADAAPNVAHLLAACPSLKVLVTSRVPLRIRGEKEHPVPPLSLPAEGTFGGATPERLTQYEAVRLFIERATDVKPGFQVTNDNAPAVAEICVRLDGLPLAIELAAARIRLLTPQTMLSRLQSRLKLLTGGPRDAAARQQTLRSAIDWSYDLLSEGEKQLFRRLAVFQGGRNLEAIEQVCNAEGDLQVDVLEGVESLMAKSLLRQEEGVGGESRFVMLETIHEYAREKLEESGDAVSLRKEYARYFLSLAENASEKRRRSAHTLKALVERLEVEHDNMRAVLRWARQSDGMETRSDEDDKAQLGLRLAAALAWFWRGRRHIGEGREYLLGFLGMAYTAQGGASPVRRLSADALRLRANALVWASAFTCDQGDFGQASLLAKESLALSREIGDKRIQARALAELAAAEGYQGDLSAASSHYEESLTLNREVSDEAGMVNALRNLGYLAMMRGDYAGAHALLEEALALSRKVADEHSIGFALENLGELAYHAGDYEAARISWEESQSIFRRLADKSRLAIQLHHLGYVALRTDNYQEAGALFVESLSLCQELGAGHMMTMCLAGFAAVAGAQGQLERAGRLYGTVEAQLQSTKSHLDLLDRVELERTFPIARTQLAEERWRHAWKEGSTMSIERAFAYALQATAEPTE